MHYRSGPSLGLTYEEAKAAGLQSAMRGKAVYESYVEAYHRIRDGVRHVDIKVVTPEPLRHVGTLSLDTFSKARISAATAISIAKGRSISPNVAHAIDAAMHNDMIRGMRKGTWAPITSSKVPMKKEKR